MQPLEILRNMEMNELCLYCECAVITKRADPVESETWKVLFFVVFKFAFPVS